ncbi:MAG: hypothetical protein MH252_01825 [Thermosynechococcaceae cyanobacterium MS004]|nr:hypothetical protein [Thermosynechococcaceae cyanobacterium MS004]
MWPLTTLKSADNDEILCDKIIADYLMILPDSGQWEDTEILEKLVRQGHSKILSWYVIGLIPIIAGRELMDGMGITFSNSVVLYDDEGKPTSCIKFKDFSVYQAIQKSWNQIRQHPNIKNLMMCGAEFHCVNTMLNNGSNSRNLVLVEPGLLRPS